MSDLPAEEVELVEDPDEVHKIYKQSFIDEQVLFHKRCVNPFGFENHEKGLPIFLFFTRGLFLLQEWYLYKYIESEIKEVTKDRADPTLMRATVTVRCKAARRCMYFIWNIFSVTVRPIINPVQTRTAAFASR